MPIKHISDIRRPPRVGKIRLGVKAISPKSGNEYPKAVDFLVVDPEDGITSKSAAESFRQVYGDKPREISILFPCDDPAVFFPQFLKRYGSGSGLLCKGDGEKAQMVDKETGELVEIDCNPAECEFHNSEPPSCRRDATLQFLLPEVSGLGVWVIDSSSFYSIVNLNSAVDFIKSITGGRIAMIPLTLRLRPQEVAPGGRKKTVYVLDLGHDKVTLRGILQASTQTPAAMLLPHLDESEAPDDLYARSVREGPKPTGQAEPKPAGRGPIAAPASSSPQPAQAAEPEVEEQGEADETDQAIEALFKQLGFTPAKQKALVAGYPARADLLAALQQQAAAKSEPTPAGKRASKPKPASAPPTPPPPPKTAPRSYF